MEKDNGNNRNHDEWIKAKTEIFGLRFMKSTGIPDAIRAAAEKANETPPEYMKRAIVIRLKNDGFLSGVDYVPNLNKARHKKKLEDLKKYIEEEEKKLK